MLSFADMRITVRNCGDRNYLVSGYFIGDSEWGVLRHYATGRRGIRSARKGMHRRLVRRWKQSRGFNVSNPTARTAG